MRTSGGVVLAVEWLRLWSQARMIVLAPIAFGAAGCSADPARFNDDSFRGQPEATGVITTRPAPGRAASGSWSWDGGTAVTVARGDTVDTIARRRHVPASVIIQANNLGSSGTIQPGQRLVIPRYSPAPVSVAPEAPLAGAARLVPPGSIPANGSANGNAGVAAGGAAPIGAPEDTRIKISRHSVKSPAAVAKANNIPAQARVSGGHEIVQPLKAANARQPGRPAPEQHPAAPAAPKLAVVAPAEKPAGADPVKATDAAPSFHWPVRGQVISGFGPKADGQRNNGIDIAVPENTPIKAADDGVVIYSGNELKSFGNLLLVRHSNNYITAYAHAKELRVKRGDAIKSGEIIGMSGQTGDTGTPEIHFEVRKGSTPVDPMPLLHGA
jgi:murein DD-endopeptidase MepM/ murein hydrolase activator NlpD